MWQKRCYHISTSCMQDGYNVARSLKHLCHSNDADALLAHRFDCAAQSRSKCVLHAAVKGPHALALQPEQCVHHGGPPI